MLRMVGDGQQHRSNTVITIKHVNSKSGLGGGGGDGKDTSASTQASSKRGGSSAHRDTLVVGVSLLVFMVFVWLYGVHRLYIAHLEDKDALTRPMAVLERDR